MMDSPVYGSCTSQLLLVTQRKIAFNYRKGWHEIAWMCMIMTMIKMMIHVRMIIKKLNYNDDDQNDIGWRYWYWQEQCKDAFDFNVCYMHVLHNFGKVLRSDKWEMNAKRALPLLKTDQGPYQGHFDNNGLHNSVLGRKGLWNHKTSKLVRNSEPKIKTQYHTPVARLRHSPIHLN